MKIKRKIIEIDEALCDGCGLCVPSCAEGAIRLADGKARLVAEKYCDGLGACLGECPRGALRVVEGEVDAYDESAVHEHLKAQASAREPAMACGCPSALIRDFSGQLRTSPAPDNRGKSQNAAASALTHWPIQIKLVPPNAPFLRDAELLVAADCTAAAYPGFQDALEGKVLLIGCPKFDDAQAYIQKFAQIFKANSIKGVTALVMEVPCCHGLPVILEKAMDLAGRSVPIRTRVVGVRGELIGQTPQC